MTSEGTYNKGLWAASLGKGKNKPSPATVFCCVQGLEPQNLGAVFTRGPRLPDEDCGLSTGPNRG